MTSQAATSTAGAQLIHTGFSLLAVANGDPKSPGTFSGIPASLLQRLDGQARIEVLDVSPGRVTEALAAGASFSLNLARWRARYRPSPPFALSMRARALRAASRRSTPADALLQFGSWFDLNGLGGLCRGPRAAYVDTNFASFTRRPDVHLNPTDRLARWRMSHEKGIYDQLDVIFTCSNWARRSMVEDFGQSPEKVVVVGAGPNLDPLRPVASREPGRARFLFIGKKWERKGGPLLLEAFEILRRQVKDAELWIVGPERRSWPTSPGVVHWGRLNAADPAERAILAHVLEHATAFAMPSQFEPFGLALLDAMAHGLACIGSDTCAMPEIIDHGVTGLVVPRGDVRALADALLSVARDVPGTIQMGVAGRARAHALFTWERTADRIVQELGSRV